MTAYTKMHGAGNGFVLIDNMNSALSEDRCRELAVQLCREEGTDGLIAVIPAADADFGMLFINSDGSIGEMCGNGARCAARYGYEHGFSADPSNIRFRAAAGLITAERITDSDYRIRLTDPSVTDLHREVSACGKNYDCFYVEQGDPGIPHAVVFVPESTLDDLDDLRPVGRALRSASAFPKGANIDFAHLRKDGTFRAITFERGVEDFTKACGTGCGAIATAAFLRGIVCKCPVEIDMPGGHLSITLDICGNRVSNVYLTGPTAYF